RGGGGGGGGGREGGGGERGLLQQGPSPGSSSSLRCDASPPSPASGRGEKSKPSVRSRLRPTMRPTHVTGPSPAIVSRDRARRTLAGNNQGEHYVSSLHAGSSDRRRADGN